MADTFLAPEEVNELTGKERKRVQVYLDDESIAAAASLGEGNVSEGIRRALDAPEGMV